jgi:hypothetical protein
MTSIFIRYSLCDLEALSALEGTAHMHTLILGKEITGISAFV